MPTKEQEQRIEKIRRKFIRRHKESAWYKLFHYHKDGMGYSDLTRITKLSRHTVRYYVALLEGRDMRKLANSVERLREKVRIRDNHTCQICFIKWFEGQRRFDVHHLDEHMEGKKAGREVNTHDRANMDRLITLCHKCHMQLRFSAK